MSYYPTIPQASDDPLVSQGELLTNFSTIGSDFGVNHVALGAVSNAGKHKWVEMPNQGSIPSPLSDNEGTLYTKLITRSAVSASQMFWTPDNSGNEYQMSTSLAASFSLFGINTNNYNAVGVAYTGGWTFLPGGLILQYGLYNGGASLGSSGTIPFPVTFSSTPFVVIPTLVSKVGGTSQTHTVAPRSGGVGTGGFVWDIDDSSSITSYTGIYWMAIGN